MKRTLLILAAIVALIAVAIPAAAITRGGAPDDGEHPFVGIMVAYANEKAPLLGDVDESGVIEDDELFQVPLWRCSGTLISETVFVTAGHCSENDGSWDGEGPTYDGLVGIWFDELEADVRGNGYFFYEEATYTGVRDTHPLYDPGAFYLYDLGVVTLDGAGNTSVSEFGELPDAGDVDELKKGRRGDTIEAVGYGVQRTNPALDRKNQEERALDRRKADLMIVNRKGVAGIGPIPDSNSIVLSGDAKNGGTCFGDSGGPLFINDSNVIAAVTSFGLNPSCGGVGGGFRIDRDLELGWINSFLG